MSPSRLLLIDRDEVVRTTLADLLRAAGHTVAAVPEVVGAAGCDLVIIEEAQASAFVPLDGCKVLRLGAGGVPKPVRPGVLLARVAEMLARQDEGVAIGPWRFDCAQRLLLGEGGLKVRLTDKEAAILEYLARAGAVVARETLLAEVWGYSAAITTHTLETHIYRLRRKIERNPAKAELLLTEAGGYRLAL